MSKRHRQLRLAAVICSAVVFAASCGSGSEQADEPDVATSDSGAKVTTTTAPITTIAAELTTTRVPLAPIYDVWLTPDNANHLSFNEDDTWTFTHAQDPERIRGFGPFTFDGELLTLFTDRASKNCSRSSGAFDTEITGTYEAAITSEGNLELTDVDDQCVPRKIEFRGSLIDKDQKHQRGTLVPYSP